MGGTTWMSGSTYPSPGPPKLSYNKWRNRGCGEEFPGGVQEQNIIFTVGVVLDFTVAGHLQQVVVGWVDHAHLSPGYSALREQAVHCRGVYPATYQLDAGVISLDWPHGADGGDSQGGELKRDTALPAALVQEMLYVGGTLRAGGRQDVADVVAVDGGVGDPPQAPAGFCGPLLCITAVQEPLEELVVGTEAESEQVGSAQQDAGVGVGCLRWVEEPHPGSQHLPHPIQSPDSLPLASGAGCAAPIRGVVGPAAGC